MVSFAPLSSLLKGAAAAVALPAALATAALAQSGPVPLGAGFGSHQMNGTTVGTYSLANLAARDRNDEYCLGYAHSEPDYVVELQDSFASLTVAVNSYGGDTTLAIQGPGGDMVCNDNADRRNSDALIQDSFDKGTYRIWVGSFAPDGRLGYDLKITE